MKSTFTWGKPDKRDWLHLLAGVIIFSVTYALDWLVLYKTTFDIQLQPDVAGLFACFVLGSLNEYRQIWISNKAKFDWKDVGVTCFPATVFCLLVSLNVL